MSEKEQRILSHIMYMRRIKSINCLVSNAINSLPLLKQTELKAQRKSCFKPKQTVLV